MGRTLGRLGIDGGLEVVGIANNEERRISDEEWLGFWDEFRVYYEEVMATRAIRLDLDHDT